jgi:hypothetical protein
MAAYELLLQRPAYRLARVAGVCIFVPTAPPDATFMHAVETICGLVTDERKIAFFLFVPDDAPSPAGGDAMAAKRGFELLGTRVSLMAITLEGTGFIAAAKRSVITFAITAFNRKVSLKVFGVLAEAAAWTELQSKMAGFECPPPIELVEAVQRVRHNPQG